MLLVFLACTPPPDPGGGEILAPFDGGDEEERDDEDTDPEEETGPEDTGAPVVEAPPPTLYINEVMVDNAYSYYVDGGYPDWVEIYNASVETVSLSRITLTDASGRVWLGSEGEIVPGAFAVILADGAPTSMHAPFSLDNDGDTLTLAVDGQAIDRIATGELDSDLTWARFPDAGEWSPTSDTTPGESNGTTPSLDLEPSIFNLDSVYPVTLSMDSASYASLNSSGRTYTETALIVGDTVVDPVAVRLRGSMTYQPITGKAAFKIDMNRYDQLRFRGRENFNVLNMFYEPALMREYLDYHMFREFGVPAARNAYAWVDLSVDGGTPEDFGLYMLSETYDDTFLRDWYGNSDGYLWKPGSGDLSASSVSGWDCEEGYPCDNTVIEPISDLLDATATDANVEAIEEHLDLDNALRMIAMENAVGQVDGYCAVHNYRVYWNPEDGRATLIPSSLDLSMGNMGYPHGNYFSCSGRILAWCLSNEDCEERYVAILYEMADAIEDMSLPGLVDEIDALIDPYAEADADTRAQYSYAQYQSNRDAVRLYVEALPDEIRTSADAR